MKHDVRFPVWVALVLSAATAPLESRGQTTGFTATVKTSDGGALRLVAPTFVYSESHTAPGYIIGPSVTEDHALEHVPVTMAFGTVFVPFHLVKSIASARRVSRQGATAAAVTVTLQDGSALSGTLGADFLGFKQRLTGEGAFGKLEIGIEKIVEVAFETMAPQSKTFRMVSQRAGGPYSVMAAPDTLRVTSLLGSGTFNSRGNGFTLAKLDVGGVSFEPDFSKISAISVTTAPAGNASQDPVVEFALGSGEKLAGPLKSWHTFIWGESAAGLVVISLRKPLRVTRQ